MMRPVIHCFMPVNVKETAVTADSPERRRLPMLLRRAWYGLNQAFRRRIAHLKLTPDQFTVMRTLLEHDGISQRELTTLMSSDPNTVTPIIILTILNRIVVLGGKIFPLRDLIKDRAKSSSHNK